MGSSNYRSPEEISHLLTENIGRKKISTSLDKVFVLGVLAGAYVAFGGALATLVGHDLSKYFGIGFSKFIFGSVFSVGLMMVLIAGAELFTGNVLMVMTVFSKLGKVGPMLTRWVVVYIGNFVGSILVALLYFYSDLWQMNDGEVGAYAVKIAKSKVDLTFLQAFSRAILCNWLVCIAVYMSLSANNTIGKIFSIFFPIMAFVSLGFEHSVANMYFIPFGIMVKGVHSISAAGLSNLDFHGFFLNNLLPVTLGNIVGGAFFVGTIYWYLFSGQKRNANYLK